MYVSVQAYRSGALSAIEGLDGKVIKGRDIKVRLAVSNSTVKVSHLHQTVSNELLLEAFSEFGEVERAVVVADDRGRSLGYGIVDFTCKAYAMAAIRRCSQEHLLLTKSPMPVLVSEFTQDNEEDGQPDRVIPRNTVYYE